jgi:acetyl-CoA C-acetyltransferase
MHMTKHVFGVYSTRPGPVSPPPAVPEPERVPIVDTHAGPATVAAYSVVHGPSGDAEWGLAVCDVPSGSPAARCYARFDDADLLAEAEVTELVGRVVQLEPDGPVNRVAGPAS